MAGGWLPVRGTPSTSAAFPKSRSDDPGGWAGLGPDSRSSYVSGLGPPSPAWCGSNCLALRLQDLSIHSVQHPHVPARLHRDLGGRVWRHSTFSSVATLAAAICERG